MKESAKRVIVLNVVGLTPAHLADNRLTNLRAILSDGAMAKVKPPFPAVTGTVQATFLTGLEPSRHGVVCNGYFDRKRQMVTMWEQTGINISGEMIWDTLKRIDPTAVTAVLFWQFIKFASADIVITPSPVHTTQGVTQWCFSKPTGWYEGIASEHGPFPLHFFWGPLASIPSTEWIAKSALDTVRTIDPKLTLVYLPNLDYDAQRYGPDSAQANRAMQELDNVIGNLVSELKAMKKWDDTAFVIFSEYAFQPVTRPVYINRILREHGWLKINHIGDKEYLDLYNSKAFALADHQIAHIYASPEVIDEIITVLENTDGVDQILGKMGKRNYRIDHPNAGELIAVAAKDAWFTYYWWFDDSDAPLFTKTVDIHRKPGYDPVELFIDKGTGTIPLTPHLIKGSHGGPVTREEDMVSILACGPGTGDLVKQPVWEMRDITGYVLGLLGHSK
jgi:predicted AlkP superfamily pyrophosphatase or phosphodiesterase